MNLEILDKITKDFKAKSEKVVKAFSDYIAKISPDTIDLAKIQSIEVIKQNVHNGNVIVNKYMQRGVKIEPINPVEWKRACDAIDKVLKAENMLTRSDGSSLIATLPEITSEIRANLAKEVLKYKENYKQSLNDLWRDFKKDIKDMKMSEDLQRRGNSETEDIKNKMQAELDKIATAKQNALKG